MESPQKSVTVIVKGYPRLSETFVAQELHALECRGLRLRIASLRRPTDDAVHPVHKSIKAPVNYLPEYLHQEPRRVLNAWKVCRGEGGYRSARSAWISDLSKDPTRNRIRRFGQALVLAAELPNDTGFLYVHFLHTPGSVARYTSMITGIPWACSAHAKDIWTTPEWEKRQKIGDCDWMVTCTSTNREHLGSFTDDPQKIRLVYHGLDFGRFGEPDERRSERIDQEIASHPAIILSVGRAVEKKGYEDLLKALAELPRDMEWRFIHIGGGELLPRLKSTAEALGISNRIDWRGPQPQDEVLRAYRSADIFALACRITEDGDRDGLPNVLLEAQSQMLPCVSTRISGVPELVEHGVTGLLVEQKNPAALADALAVLIREPGLRLRYGNAGFERVRSRFSVVEGIDKLVRMFPAPVLVHPNR